jgi:hypothetical protein
VVLIPFDRADQRNASIDDTDLLAAQEKSGAAVRLFIKLGKMFENDEDERSSITQDIEHVLKRKNVAVESRILRIYTILLFFTIKVCFVFIAIASCLINFCHIQLTELTAAFVTRAEIMQYFEDKIVNVIKKWQTFEPDSENEGNVINNFVSQVVSNLRKRMGKISISEVGGNSS